MLGIPLVEGLDGVGPLHVDAWNGPLQMRFLDFLIDESVAKADAVGISSGVTIIDAAHASPVQSAQAHRAWFTAAVDHTSVELEVVHHRTSLANGIDLGMGRRIVGQRHGVAGRRDNFSVPHNNSAKRATALVDIRAGNFTGHFHEVAVLVGNDNI